MRPYSIIIADDHTLFRKGVRRLVEDLEHITVVGEAVDGLDLLKLLKHVKPDLVTLDISMPNLRGLEAIHEIKSVWPDIKILVLTMHGDVESLRAALSAGADGYLLKQDSETDFISALDQTMDGENYISAMLYKQVSASLIGSFRGIDDQTEEVLTPRQRQVLKLIAEGKTNKKIAILLNISAKTVEHHRANIMSRLKLSNIVELIRYAVSKGYINDS